MLPFFGILIGMTFTIFIYSVYIIVGSFVVWMVIDAGKQDRLWWMVVIIGMPVIGALVYYFTEKKHEYAKAPVHHIHESETERQHEHAHNRRSTEHHESHEHLANK